MFKKWIARQARAETAKIYGDFILQMEGEQLALNRNLQLKFDELARNLSDQVAEHAARSDEWFARQNERIAQNDERDKEFKDFNRKHATQVENYLSGFNDILARLS